MRRHQAEGDASPTESPEGHDEPAQPRHPVDVVEEVRPVACGVDPDVMEAGSAVARSRGHGPYGGGRAQARQDALGDAAGGAMSVTDVAASISSARGRYQVPDVSKRGRDDHLGPRASSAPRDCTTR